MDWLDEFKNPPARCRIKPFWFWNGDMAEDEIKHQIEEMSDKGLGGAFICARQGQKVPYLSEEWFKKVSFAAEEAVRCGLETWLYDEYPYPSGMSGGEVLLEHPEAEHMVLNHRSLNLPEGGTFEMNLGWCGLLYAKAFPAGGQAGDGSVDFAHPVDLEALAGNLQTEEIYQTTGLTKYNNKRFFTYRPERILKGTLPAGSWRVEVYTQAALGEFKYYGGFFDPCSKEAVQTFLKTTHEKYEKYMGEKFGSRIYGMFSDEVGLLSPIPWSKRLPEYFKQVKGYDLLEHLPALHNAAYENAYAIRYDLYDAIHKLFVESYHKQVSDWCGSHHLEYATEVPSMRMSTQRYSAIVGGDTAHEKLGRPLEWIYDEYIRKYRSNAKAVSSLTRQLGKQFSMIESFHSLGWTMTLQDAKWMFDRLGASGINFYNVHAFYYTIDSITKHDAPPSQFLQNPYWKHYRLLADYAGRLGTWVTNTEADIHVAVLDPAATLWAYLGEPFIGFVYQGEDEAERQKCDQVRKDWVAVCKELLFNQIDYEHLDTEILEHAEIRDGEILIGRASYRVLVIPPTDFIEAAACEKIREFAACGGKIVFLGNLPEAVIDRKQERADWTGLELNQREDRRYFEEIWDGAWCEWCREAADLSFGIKTRDSERKDIISSVREDGGTYYVFLVNQGGRDTEVSVTCRRAGCVYDGELCLDTGEVKTAAAPAPMEAVSLRAYESRMLRFGKCGEKGMEGEAVGIDGESGKGCETVKGCESVNHCDYGSRRILRSSEQSPEKLVIDTSDPMPVTIEGGNIFRLEEFLISRDGEEWFEVPVKTFIEQCADQSCLKPEDYQFTGAFGIPKKISIHYPLAVTYKTGFEVETVPETCSLLMDRGAVKDTWRMTLNGEEIGAETFRSVFINDQNNRMADIAPFLKKGWNELAVEVMLTKDSDGIRDPLYLYGDFGVSETEAAGRRRLTAKPETAAFTLDYIRGFPYYSGTFTFRTVLDVKTVPQLFDLELDKKDQCHECLEIIVNGVSTGVRAFSPYTWHGDGAMLRQGENQIEIRLTNTLAPMLDGTWFDYEKHCLVKC